MNSPKEPEPGPVRRGLQFESGYEAGQILSESCREGAGFARETGLEEFIGG
ncbi:MAG TPA: hypothetical protein VIW23_16040 [Candidatus Acidoferrum sp.]|jgi:hypothetical protein